MQCSAEKFHNWGQCPTALEKVGTFEKKGGQGGGGGGEQCPTALEKVGTFEKKGGGGGHCGKNDGTVIWRSKISFPSLCVITDHPLTVNKQY